MLCLYVYNVLPPQRLPGSFEDSLCNGQRKIKETRFKKKKKKKKTLVVLPYTMLHTMFQGHWSIGSREDF